MSHRSAAPKPITVRRNYAYRIYPTRWQHSELERQLRNEKATDAGRQVVRVPARHTSQTCHACGHVDPRNRRTQALFTCLACGHTAHADVNAAQNIIRLARGPAPRTTNRRSAEAKTCPTGALAQASSQGQDRDTKPVSSGFVLAQASNQGQDRDGTGTTLLGPNSNAETTDRTNADHRNRSHGAS